MIKLYKKVEDILYYWETWRASENSGIFHYGKVGEKGFYEEIQDSIKGSYSEILEKELALRISEGYSEFCEDNLEFIEILIKVKMISKEYRMNYFLEIKFKIDELLGWRGLGHVDDISFDTTDVNIFCVVVNHNISKLLITNFLKRIGVLNQYEVIIS